MDRIAVDSLGQFFGPVIGIGGAVYHTIRVSPCDDPPGIAKSHTKIANSGISGISE